MSSMVDVRGDLAQLANSIQIMRLAFRKLAAHLGVSETTIQAILEAAEEEAGRVVEIEVADDWEVIWDMQRRQKEKDEGEKDPQGVLK